MPGVGGMECWATVAMDTEEAVKALVLAKGLRRFMTLRPLVLVASPTLPDDVWELLQFDFDVVVRLERRWLEAGVNPHTAAKVMVWSLSKWQRVIFLAPGTMLVRGCEEIFEKSVEKNATSSDNSVMSIKPEVGVWRKLVEGLKNMGAVRKGNKLEQEQKLFSQVLGQQLGRLDDKFCTSVDLKNGLMAKNLNELAIVHFTADHPMEILCKDELSSVSGTLESAIMQLWKDNLDHGVAQQLAKLETHHFNGLKSYLDQYRPSSPLTGPESALSTLMDYQDSQLNDIKNSVAIIGMSCRFPGANTLAEFWQLLIEGRDAICSAPEGRWTSERCPVLPEDSKNSHAGFLSCSVDDFDGKFFGVSPMELEFMDPQQRLTLQVAWEALEDAGINPVSLQNSYTGVYGGAWRTDYREALQNAGVGETEFFRSYLGNSFGVLTARISHTLGLTGPSVCTESGCSSSIVAVDLACKSLLRGETNLSLACGVNLLIHPFTGKTMHTVLAPDGHCKTFDAAADGFGRAEGCGVLVLKRYSDAVKDKDRVWGLIRGSAVVQEGASRSLGTPTKYCEALAMSLALQDAGVEAKDVSFVETHGTGTPVGDPLEVAAVASVYSEGREEPLTIGSVKTNIGHTESCSGIAGIIKVVLSMNNEVIPPHKNFTSLNPSINLDSIPAQIPLEAMEWKRDPKRPRIAGVSSFGITGTDAHAIVQETPQFPHPTLLRSGEENCRPVHILTISGKNEEALEDSLGQFKEFLENTNEKLENIAHTSNVGRGQFLHRAAIVAKDNAEMLEKLKSANSILRKVAPEEAPKICFLFTGQGSQYPGMARKLYEHNFVFKMHFDQCDTLLSREYGIEIKDALWGQNGHNLIRTIYSQTSIFCVEYCLLQLWASWGITPDYVLGHSLGEFAAAVGAGILSFADALKLVAERSRLIDNLPRGKMLVLKESKEKVDFLLKKAFEGTDKWLDYAAVNSPEQTVLAGSEEHILAFAEFCKNNQIKTHVLEATHAFHSRHMDPILEDYRSVAETVVYSKPTKNTVYVSGMEGRVVEESEGVHVNADYWVRHTRDSVRFSAAARDLMGRGCTLFLEAGPHPVLSALTMINSDGVPGLSEPVVCLPSIRKQEDDWSCMLTTVGKLFISGLPIDWKQFDQFEPVVKTTVPFYSFQNKSYWFEIPDRGPGQIHPLVGTLVSNASAMKLFQNQLNLEDAEFLKDHVIGNKVIFPGAGFMEMCLVAGHSATQCTDLSYFHPPGPITLSDFVIESPLGLSETEVAHLQAIVTSSEESGDTKVTIYSRLSLDKETQKWIRHASATFSPYAVQSVGKDEEDTVSSFSQLLEQFKYPTHISETYSKLAEFGLKFGPTFQTLRKMFTKVDTSGNDEDGEGHQNVSGALSETLFEVNVTQVPSKYVCHPVVMDALFQAVMITAHPSESKLHVPVSVGKFISFAPIPADAETAYIHCKLDGSGDIRATLMDVEGNVLGQMEGAILMETTVGAIMSALEAQKLSLPTMYEDVWRSQFGPMERRAELPKVLNYTEVQQPEVMSDWIQKYNIINEEQRHFNTKSDRLYALYMIKGLLDLGLSATLAVGEEVFIKDFVSGSKILPGLAGFVRFMFIQLERDGYFVGCNKALKEALSFKLVKSLPSPEALAEEIDSLYKLAHALSPGEVEYVSATGTRLATILTGKESALPLLFPEDPSAGSAEAYYMTAKMSLNCHANLNAFMAMFFKDSGRLLDENKQTIRILEVGAGTGSFTKTLLPHLQGSGANWEFTYTDLSQVFFAKGEKVFENSKIKVNYRILNIEEDIVSQGFFPAHYDIIIANNVIHVAKSIQGATRNLRNLLREDGVLLVSEGIVPVRGTVMTFGLLEAYWNYEVEDFPLRGYGCEISLDKWKNVMLSAGYASITGYPIYDNRFALIVARNVSGGQVYKVPFGMEVEKRAWLVFSENGPISTYIQNNLKSLGKNVISIRMSKSFEHFEKLGELEYAIRSDTEADMTKLMQTAVKDAGLGLEGIVYLWGLLNIEEGNVTPVAQPFLHICKSIVSQDSPKLYVVTKSIMDVGDHELAAPTSAPLYGMLKCFKNEVPGAIARCIDLDDSTQVSEEQMKEVFSEFITDDEETFVAYRGGQRFVPRCVPWKPANTALSFPKSEKFRLLLPASNAISDLRFGPHNAKWTLKEGEVEIRVKAYALNFRDVFAVLKPSVEFESMNTVGIDWSGVVTAIGPNVTKWNVGDAVFSTNLNGDALPSHNVMLNEDFLMPIPDFMTFNEAATIPAVAATAYLCLVEEAKLTSKDTILIHTASGGVGLVAIQIAQSIGARIVATAGSKRKRAYLRNLGIQHIFHSRNTNYETEIRAALGGQGVDVVLNSLTSAGFKEASLSLVNPGGRFIEMSKLNTWTVEEVSKLRSDVAYTIVDLSAASPTELQRHMVMIKDYIKDSIIRPIPYTRFDASEIREALTFLQKAKHVGKIVVTMPEPEMDGLIPMFNERSTYLITGGLGGIGMEVAKWMVGSGAKHVALVGRSAPTDKAADEIRRMNLKGKNVFALQYDVGDEVQCGELLARLQELDLPPLRGVMHAAGVISDSIYSNQTWEKYTTTYNPKVRGGWNLHKLTKNYRLEHFVMFSSAVASLGSLGQSNHASANFFLDSLAHYRHFSGLPATTVNWGQWGQVGVAANIEIAGLRSFSALQGISALERVMKSQRLQACVCDADFSIVKEIFSGTRRYLEELKLNQNDSTKELVINNEQFWNDYDSANDDETRLEVLKRFVRSMIRQILKLGKDEAMNDDENFQDLGMDSLMMIEMKNVVQSTLGKRATITVSSVKDCHTVNQLAARLVKLLSGIEDDVPTPTRDELLALMREDSILPESIKPAPLPPCSPSKVKTILITGVTGNMGPYFLRELTSLPHISKIYCIIRDEKDHSASTAGRRLEKKLAGKGMSTALDWSKVTILPGHLNRPRLGLGEEEYAALASEVDAVVHLAVKSNFTDEYKKIDKPESEDIRTVNVKGTLNVLDFVTAVKTKLLFHASSIVANNTIDKDFSMAEFWPKEHDFDDMPNSAYPISKFVCDRLMGAAVEERGLPVKVFRFPAVGGETTTGANVDYENNQLMLRMMSYLHLGFMPALPIPFFILPVDVCVRLALRVFFDDDTPSDIYNVYNPYPHNETELVLIGHDMGYRIEIVEPDDFQEQFAAFEDSKLIHFLKEASGNKDAQNRFLKDSPAIMSAYTRNPTHAFTSKKLSQLIPEEYPKQIENTLSVVRRDLEYAKSSGIFAKFGI